METWNFKKQVKNNIIYFSIPSFDETNLVKNCFTSRIGGVSSPPYDSLNFGLKTKDSDANVRQNYEIISELLNINTENIIISDQVHKDNILIVDNSYRSQDIFLNNRIKEVDALITNKSNIALLTIYADCVPIFILDKKKSVIALAHAGWRGTLKKIGKQVIQKMVEVYNTNPHDCIVAIGPSIGQCCYEVDNLVIDKFKSYYTDINQFVIEKKEDKFQLNLWRANEISLIECGIPKENITISNICTKCNNNLFFSHRADNGKTGRMAAILQLKN